MCAGFLIWDFGYGHGWLAAKIYRKYTILGRSGVGKGLGILHELRELRKKGNGWPLHDPNTMGGYVISQTPTTIAKCEALSGPNHPLWIMQKWRDCPTSRFH